MHPGAAPLVDIPMCSGMGEIGKEEGGACARGDQGKGRKAVVGRPTAQVASSSTHMLQ